MDKKQIELINETIRKTIISEMGLEEVSPDLSKAGMKFAGKKEENYRVEYRNDLISTLIDDMTTLSDTIGMMENKQKILASEFQLDNLMSESYPFPVGLDELYKKVVHWMILQTELLNQRYINTMQ